MSVAAIGAGDCIGGVIARKLATEGFVVFPTGSAARSWPLIAEVVAAGGCIVGCSFVAPEEEYLVTLLQVANVDIGGRIRVVPDIDAPFARGCEHPVAGHAIGIAPFA
jgi:hypothetical protein